MARRDERKRDSRVSVPFSSKYVCVSLSEKSASFSKRLAGV